MEKMEHNYTGHGHISLGVSLFMGILSRVDLDALLKTSATVISIIAGIMAAINYYYSIKKNKNGTK